MDFAAKILTVSDSAARGARQDTAGDQLAERLAAKGFHVVERRTVADGVATVSAALREMTLGFSGLVVTTGGTGFSPRDLTPEATMAVIEREAPGLAEAMRAVNPLGRLSRGRCGVVGRSLVVNTPGSAKGALESLDAIVDVVGHALALLAQEPTDHPPDTGGTTATSSSGPTGV